MFSLLVIVCLFACVFGFSPKMGCRKASALRMSKEDFSTQSGVSGPFGFFDPAGISRDLTQQEFNKVRGTIIIIVIIIVVVVILQLSC